MRTGSQSHHPCLLWIFLLVLCLCKQDVTMCVDGQDVVGIDSGRFHARGMSGTPSAALESNISDQELESYCHQRGYYLVSMKEDHVVQILYPLHDDNDNDNDNDDNNTTRSKSAECRVQYILANSDSSSPSKDEIEQQIQDLQQRKLELEQARDDIVVQLSILRHVWTAMEMKSTRDIMTLKEVLIESFRLLYEAVRADVRRITNVLSFLLFRPFTNCSRLLWRILRPTVRCFASHLPWQDFEKRSSEEAKGTDSDAAEEVLPS